MKNFKSIDEIPQTAEGQLLCVAIGYIMTTEGHTKQTPDEVLNFIQEIIN